MKTMSRLDKIVAEIQSLEQDIGDIMNSVADVEFMIETDKMISRIGGQNRPIGWHLKSPKRKR
jgi:hypothetical protein